MKKYLLLISIYTLLTNPLKAQFAIDSSFGKNGQTTYDSGWKGPEFFSSIAIQADDKIVVVGANNSSLSSNLEFETVRFMKDGTVDSAFGNSGKVYTKMGNTDMARAVAIQKDGKIVVGGYTYPISFSFFALVRYNSNGSLDNTFSGDGKLTTYYANFTNDRVSSLAIQDDGKIIAGGTVDGDAAAIIRYLPDGRIDSTFSTGILRVISSIGDISSIAIQPDGKIIIAGLPVRFNHYNDFMLARLNPDSSIDSTFGVNGFVYTDFDNGSDWGRSVSLQPDGKIVVGGQAILKNGNTCYAVARYESNGALDASFGTGGKVISDFGGIAVGTSLAIQKDGKIVLGGYKQNSSDIYRFSVVRYNTNGSIDPTFGSVSADFKAIKDKDYSMGLQSDGKIVLAGAVLVDSTGDIDLGLARFNTTTNCNKHSEPNYLICHGDSVVVGNRIYKNTGTYRNSFYTQGGCDSIVTTKITTFSSFKTSYDTLKNMFTLTVDSLTTAKAIRYHWDFGDGTTSDQPTPYHVYSTDGFYNVCMKTYTNTGDSCMYCHVLGKDSLGNIKGRVKGFSIHVRNKDIPTLISSNSFEPDLTIYPNPFTSTTTIVSQKEMKNATLIVSDVLGRIIQERILNGKQFILEKGELKKGIYFLKIITENNNVITRKVIIE